MIFDPDEMATLQEVKPGSVAERSWLKAGDVIEKMNGQPLLSIADVQWVLHNADPNGDSISMQVRRGDVVRTLTLKLNQGWRQAEDISWRVSSWSLRRMSTGGLVLEPISEEERARLKLADGQMALLVKRVGQYGPHAAGKRAGFKQGDIVVEYDGQTDLMNDTQLLYWGTNQTAVGERVAVTVLRDGQRKTLKLPMQE
jgi:S1-C subfamily serine protease